MSSNLVRRIAVAAVAIPVALVVVYIGGWALAAALAVVGVLGTAELYRLSVRAGVRPLADVGYVAAALIPFAAFALSPDGPGAPAVGVAFAGAGWLMIAMAGAVAGRSPSQRPLASLAVTILGPLYAAGMPAFLVLVRHPEAPLSAWGATWLVFLPLAVVWICDSLAMAGGTLIGGPKLAPVLSPNKTWAGGITGSIGAALAAPLYGWLVLERFAIDLTIWQLIAFGAAVATVGQVGDIAESLLKREVGAKDSGTFFPGHGGVLDRLDSLYWAIPTAAFLLVLFGVV